MTSGIYIRTEETRKSLSEATKARILRDPSLVHKAREGFQKWLENPENRKRLIHSRPIPDLTGNEWGQWIVLDFQGTLKGQSQWRIRCNGCQNEKVVAREFIGRSISCSECRAKRRVKHPEETGAAARAQVYWGYLSAARKRKLEWALTEQEFFGLVEGTCYFCGCPPSMVKKSRWKSGNFAHNGIDRLNNSEGYTKENCVSCCSICNHAKHILSETEFLNWIVRVYEHSLTVI